MPLVAFCGQCASSFGPDFGSGAYKSRLKPHFICPCNDYGHCLADDFLLRGV